jgi:ribosomal protein S13
MAAVQSCEMQHVRHLLWGKQVVYDGLSRRNSRNIENNMKTGKYFGVRSTANKTLQIVQSERSYVTAHTMTDDTYYHKFKCS